MGSLRSTLPTDQTNLAAIDSRQLMKTLGNLAYQIHPLPDGSRI
jgi:hypothetical protein